MKASKYKLEKRFTVYRIVDTKMAEEIDYRSYRIRGLVEVEEFNSEEDAANYIINSYDSYITYVVLPKYEKVHDYD